MSDPFPKLMVNRAGERLTVFDFAGQDTATREGYSRKLGRDLERQEAAPPVPVQES